MLLGAGYYGTGWLLGARCGTGCGTGCVRWLGGALESSVRGFVCLLGGLLERLVRVVAFAGLVL